MAPESERANVCSRCRHDVHFDRCEGMRMSNHGMQPCRCVLSKPAPASCSEVVERLAKCAFGVMERSGFDRTKAETILHSWRERRVQELEEALELIGKETAFYYKNEADTSAKKLAAIRELVSNTRRAVIE